MKLVFSTALLLSLISTSIYGTDLEGLGDLAGGSFYSIAYSVNSDGSVVVGKGSSTNGTEAFRWTQAGGMVGLGDLAGGTFDSRAYSVNSDGSVVVGRSSSTNGDEAFRWTQAGGMVGLGDLAGGSFFSRAQSVNSDGSVVVGYSSSTNGNEAFRWTQAGGMVGLGDLAGGSFDSRAQSVNSDGSIVVGQSNSTNGNEAFRWTQAGGMVGLGDLAGGSFYSKAYSVNSDGSVVIGQSISANGYEAFRWTQAGGMVGLGDLAGGNFDSRAYSVNSDGSVVVGQSISANGYEAFRWTQANGMQSLSTWLAESGYTLSGWSGTSASGVSADGKVVAGYGTSANGTEAFIAREGSGLIGLSSFTASLESVNSVTTKGFQIVQTAMHGAHGHPGQKRALDEKRTMWVAGDLAYDDRYDSQDHMKLGEVGMSYKYNEFVTLSGALGKTWSNSILLYGGDSKSQGTYMAVDTDIKFLKEIPLYLTLSYLYQSSDIDIKRGYLNAGSLDSSTGSTSQTSQALRARLQYQNIAQVKSTFFHPYIEYNYARLDTDAYTEVGGGFPAVYNASKESVNDWRYGFDADINLNETNRLITTLEGVHRMESYGRGVSGQIVGLSAFNIKGRAYNQNWARATLGIEHTFTTGRMTLTLNTSSQGEDPRYWSGVNYSVGF